MIDKTDPIALARAAEFGEAIGEAAGVALTETMDAWIRSHVMPVVDFYRDLGAPAEHIAALFIATTVQAYMKKAMVPSLARAVEQHDTAT